MLHLLLTLLLAQEPASARLELETLDGRRFELAARDLPLADPRTRQAWIVRPRGHAVVAASRAEARLRFANGDELAGRVLGGDGESLSLELLEGVTVPCALENLRAVLFPARLSAGAEASLSAPPEGDRLYRRAASALDVLDGTIESLVAEGVVFDGVLGKRTVPWNEVAALFVAELGASRPAVTPGVPVTLEFAGEGGGRARAGLLGLEPGGARVVLAQGSELVLPYGAWLELSVADGKLTYLSQLVPSAEEGRGAPFGDELGMQWPHRMDRNVLGGELRRAGELVRRGIGMHAPSRLTFELDGSYKTLRGEIALDDSTRLLADHARGSVVFRVLADGELLFESPVVRGGDLPRPLGALSLEGRRTLVLELDPAGDFAGDRGNWLGLALVR